MCFYMGNAVYDYLEEYANENDFFWTSGNMWLLVYGDEAYEPRVLTVVSGNNRLNARETEEERAAINVARQITANTDVPVNFIRFDPDQPIERVGYWSPGMKDISIITSDELKDRFSQYGLKMNRRMAHKPINDKSSSPYHIWQRNNMGDSVVVADIDLLRYEDGVPIEIIELKRSRIDLCEWKPYQQDYKNFILISKLARKSDLEFYIVYNHRIKKPFFDDVSRLKIFEFDHSMEPKCQQLGYMTIQQFVEANT